MKICFLGTSHAAQHLSRAAKEKGFTLSPITGADLILVSEDTPTDSEGNRNLDPIRELVNVAIQGDAPVILTSAVPPGWTRSLGISDLIHQAETLRIIDATERARKPEMLIVGMKEPGTSLPDAYVDYLAAFNCPVIKCTWEEAELSKIAINTFLSAQVDTTNRLAAAAKSVGAKWSVVAEIIKHDKRIGKYAYLNPGRWQDSPHLLRDAVTLNSL